MGTQPDSADTLQQCDDWYAARGVAGRVQIMMEHLERMAVTPDWAVCWRWARGAFFLGSLETAPALRRQWFASGGRTAETSRRLAPDRVEGHLWYGINLALWAECAAPRWQAPVLVWKAKRALHRAARIDPAFHGGAADRVLGRIAHKAPFWLGGGKQKSRLHFETALRHAPDNPVTLIYLAELLLDLPDGRALARPFLEHLAQLAEVPGWEYELERDRATALVYLKQF